MLNERLSLLKKEYDALRLESASKEVALAKANDEVKRLDENVTRAAGGRTHHHPDKHQGDDQRGPG
jgi:hypothetical protein